MPSALEIQNEPKLAGLSANFTLQDVQKAAKEWREDASQNSASITYFYFAGHGVQRTVGDAVMILPEFASGLGGTLSNSIDTLRLFYGMAPSASHPSIARTQIYIVDACRIRPEEFQKFQKMPTGEVFDIEETETDNRNAPIWFAALSGTRANGLAGRATYFTEALLQSLKGAAGKAMRQQANGAVPWKVTIYSLNETLQAQMNTLNNLYGDEQEYQPGGIMKNADLCSLSGPPIVEVKMELDPTAAANVAALNILDSTNHPVLHQQPIQPYPYPVSLPAGLYILSVNFAAGTPGYRDSSRVVNVEPPEYPVKMRCY
jgi:hypothetical protein